MVNSKVFIVAKYTFVEFMASKWVLGYGLGIAMIIAIMSFFSSYFAYTAELYGRFGVSVISGTLMLTSLVSLVFPASAFSTDLELGIAEWFLARPLSYRQYVAGRFIGLSSALVAATIIAYIFSAWIAWLLNVPYWIVLVLGLVNAGVAFFLSALGAALALTTRDRVVALGAAFLAWFYFNFLHPLVVFFLVVMAGLGEVGSYIATVASPVEAGRLLMYAAIDPTLSFMGVLTATDVILTLGPLTYLAPLFSLLLYFALSIWAVLTLRPAL